MTFWHVLSCPTMYCHVMTWFIEFPSPTLYCHHLPCHVLTWHAEFKLFYIAPYHSVMYRHDMLNCPLLHCIVTIYPVMFRHDILNCHLLYCIVTYHPVMYWHDMLDCPLLHCVVTISSVMYRHDMLNCCICPSISCNNCVNNLNCIFSRKMFPEINISREGENFSEQIAIISHLVSVDEVWSVCLHTTFIHWTQLHRRLR